MSVSGADTSVLDVLVVDSTSVEHFGVGAEDHSFGGDFGAHGFHPEVVGVEERGEVEAVFFGVVLNFVGVFWPKEVNAVEGHSL